LARIDHSSPQLKRRAAAPDVGNEAVAAMERATGLWPAPSFP
jgi:hypothetical protein